MRSEEGGGSTPKVCYVAKADMNSVACTINIAMIINYAARGVIYDHSIVPIL